MPNAIAGDTYGPIATVIVTVAANSVVIGRRR